MSVIVSAYNNPAWLEKFFWGCLNQDFARIPFDIIIADDGSREEMAELIERYRKKSPIGVTHLWQPDEGFRKCRILNRAIVASQADYLIFTDQDCVPREDFLASHYDHAEEGCYLSGGYLKLPMNISERLTEEDIRSCQAFDAAWLRREYGFSSIKFSVRLVRNRFLAKCFNGLTTTAATCNGNCFSAWKEDLLAVNGFNEELGYGGLDRELGERLHNYGIRAKQRRYSLICLHLAHARPYETRETWSRNEEIRKRVLESGSYRALMGISDDRSDEAGNVLKMEDHEFEASRTSIEDRCNKVA